MIGRRERERKNNKKSVCNGCIRIGANISHIRSKNTIFAINQSRGAFGQMSVLQGAKSL